MASRPLVITADPQALEELLRIAAGAGVELDHAADPGAARGRWVSAAVVVVGHDVAPACVRLRLPRRAGVVLLGGDLDDATVWQAAVEVGAEHVVFLPDAEAWISDFLGEALEPSADAGVIVGVVGGRGGAGTTTLASALAVTAARAGHRTLLIDGDPLGGGIDLVFGGEQAGGLRWPDLEATRGRVPGSALTAALPRMSQLSVLSWDRPAALSSGGSVLGMSSGGAVPTNPTIPQEALDAVLAAGRRAADLVVVDLPRQVDNCFRQVAAVTRTMLLVVPAELRATAAAARVAAQVAPLCPDLRLVVRGPAPAGIGAADIAGALSLPLAGYLRPEPGLDAALERGEPPAERGRGPLHALCLGLIEELLAGRRAA